MRALSAFVRSSTNFRNGYSLTVDTAILEQLLSRRDVERMLATFDLPATVGPQEAYNTLTQKRHGTTRVEREQGLREATSLIEAADSLAIAARHLRTCRLHNVPAGQPGTIEDGADRSRYGMGMGRLVLFAVIVELCVKGLRLLDEPARQVVRRHVVVELYRDLAPDTQSAIEAICERCREQHARLVQAGSDKTDGVTLASIQEALAWNDEAMVSLKYDLKPKGVTIPANAMWDGDTVWFMGAGVQAENFAEALANYALGRLRGT